MRLDLEQNFIRKYVLKSKRERYVEFLAKDKTRSKFLEMLYHGQDLDKNLFKELHGNHQHQVETIRAKAKSLVDGHKCYVISKDKQWDGRELPTAQAIDEIVSNFVEATLLVFGNVAGVYYEGEPPHNCYLSV
jgi:hypothetical protein